MSEHVKSCKCGKNFTLFEWKALGYVGIQHVPEDEYGPEERLELRNCHCGSTIAVDLLSQ